MYALGVDLGTVYTAAATWREDHAEIVSLGSRGATIPSVVLLREDAAFLTGEAANRRALIEPSRVAREFKRRFGDSTPIMLGGSPYSAEALMARLLRSVVEEVESQRGGRPSALCLCHPANWGPFKIDLLQQAVRMADLELPIRFAVEPVAAAAYYASQQRLETGALVAVYDLGGGTFDAAVLRKTDDSFEIVGRPEGIEHLGGADFDAAMFEHVRGVVGEQLAALDDSQPASIASVARLREECTSAKETLSSDTDTTIPVLLPNVNTEVRITRGELERMIRPSLYDTIGCLQRAIRSAGIAPSDLHSVLLIGGSSRIPLVAQLVGAELDRPVAVDAHPKHAVALGAALIAERSEHEAPARQSRSATAAPVTAAPATAPPTPVTGQPTPVPAAPPTAMVPTTAAATPDATRAVPIASPLGISGLLGAAGNAAPPDRSSDQAATASSGRTAAQPGPDVDDSLPTWPPGSSYRDDDHTARTAAPLAAAASTPAPPTAPEPAGAPKPTMQPAHRPSPDPSQYAGYPSAAPADANHANASYPNPGYPNPGYPNPGYPDAGSNAGSPPVHPLVAASTPPTSTAPTSSPPASAPPTATSSRPVWGRPGYLMAAAAAVVVLLVGGASYLAGRNGLFGTHSPSPSPSVSASGGLSSASTSASQQALIYQCPTAADAPVWACLKSATAGDGRIEIRYTKSFTLSGIQDAAHYHFHVYLARPGTGGTTDPPDTSMQHVANMGSWYNLYDGNITTIDNATERGGQRLPLDLTGKYSLVCVRVATGLHGLVPDRHNGFRTGNCVNLG